MTNVEKIMEMSQEKLMRRGSVSKQQIIAALIETRKKASTLKKEGHSSTSKMENVLDRKLNPLQLVSDLNEKIAELHKIVQNEHEELKRAKFG